MGKRNVINILAVFVMLAAMFSLAAFPVGAAATTKINIDSVTIQGTVGETITQQVILYTNGGDGFDIGLGDTVTNWFTNAPKNSYMAAKVTDIGSNASKISTIKVEIEITPTAGKKAALSVTVPYGFIKNKTPLSDIVVTANANAAWNISPTYQVDFGLVENTSGGKVTATADNKALADGDYTAVGETLKFTAAASNKGYQLKNWRINGATTILPTLDTNNKPLTTIEVAIGADSITINGTESVNNSGTIRVEAEFEAIASAYRIAPESIQEIARNDNDVTPVIIEKELKMTFGDTVTIAAPAVTSNLKKTVSTGDTANDYQPVNSGDYAVTAAAPSAKDSIVKVEKNEDGTFVITAVGVDSAEITITASNAEGNTENKLDSGTIKFTVIVEAGETELTAENDNIIMAVTTLYGGGTRAALMIDFNNETAKIGMATDINGDEINGVSVTIGGYSLNGTTWTKITITGTKDTDISALLNKSCSNLKFTERLDKNNKPAEKSAVWTIGETESRLAKPKLKVVYGVTRNDGIFDGTRWTVTGYDSENGELVYAESKDKKIPAESYREFNEITGIEVKDLPKDMKPLKTVYFAKLAPVITSDESGVVKSITPGSQAVKLTVSSQIKPQLIKVDYKKEIVSVKAGIAYEYGLKPSTEPDAPAESLVKELADVKTNISFKDESETAYILKDVDIGKSAEFTYWTEANGKRPQSAKTTLKIYNYTAWTDKDTAAVERGYDKSKHTYKLPKGYEAFDEGKGKWVTSLKVKGNSATVDVRKKGNAKFDVKNKLFLKAGTNPASETKKLTVTWSEYPAGVDKNKEPIIKQGVTDAKVLIPEQTE